MIFIQIYKDFKYRCLLFKNIEMTWLKLIRTDHTN